jgi:catechol 2,3-dioxygenase-like lactoylglutathione lyase family enzyme
MKIERLDHVNLTVADIARSCDFYTRVIGMEAVTWGEGRAAVRFGAQKINLDAAGNSPGRPEKGGCRLTSALSPRGLSPRSSRISIAAACLSPGGRGPRSGANGTIQSVYITDPDQNSIEISTY